MAAITHRDERFHWRQAIQIATRPTVCFSDDDVENAIAAADIEMAVANLSLFIDNDSTGVEIRELVESSV